MMSSQQKHKLKIIWFLLPIIGILMLAFIVVPPMIHLNSFRPTIENIILNKTGVSAKIHGDVNFSLLGKVTIIAHDISIPKGFISSCEFRIPLIDLFDFENAHISSDIILTGADLTVDKITPFDINNHIILNDSKLTFLNKQYDIITAYLSKYKSHAIVRTDQHKYEIESVNNDFVVKNKNNDLKILGKLFPDGTAKAEISITAQNINRWFEFSKPKIDGHFPITANVNWNGNYGFEFYNIFANGVTGTIVLQEDGYKIVKLKTNTANYDMSFILKDTDILQDASFELDLYGKIKFLDKTFKHLYVNVYGSKSNININKIIADDLNIHGGTIDDKGAHYLQINLPENGIDTTCTFSGTPDNWSCDNFSYGDTIFGNLNVYNDVFDITVSSHENLEDINMLINSAKRFGTQGFIYFDFPNMAGDIEIKKNKQYITYDFANNKNLIWANIDLPFLPESMLTEPGDFMWENDTITFIPASKTWYLSKTGEDFYINGDNFKIWAPDLDLQSLNDLSYSVSGNYKKGNISDLRIEIANHIFTGSASQKSITLKTDLLNLDSFISQQFLNYYDELSFFIASPITVPFNLRINVALSTDSLIYNGQIFSNFVYSLKHNSQTFSISDANRGNLLATLNKKGHNYDLNIQLNKFVFNEKLLRDSMPLNISDTTVTAEIKLKTNGKIAHDIWDNLSGTFDATFNGGILYGLGLNNFYASASNITKLNIEEILSHALYTGTTPIKKMRIIGNYEKGDIKMTKPLTLSMRHVDATGLIEIINNNMSAKLKLILRGTSPSPEPIELTIHPDNKRAFSLSEIMLHFDPEYMRTFTQTHEKF